jgi:hypothetical protein|tara:strand:- start:2658 stop:3737 length:1080 start_codon:yes stop_codon:yes gene_type:complete
MKGYLNNTILIIISLILYSCEGIPIEYLDNDDILEFEIRSIETGEIITEVLGDGETQIQLFVKISDKADAKYRDITFETSDGYFIINGVKSIEKKVDISGQTSVILKVPLGNDRLYLSAKIKNAENNIISEKVIDLLEYEDIIKLNILDSSQDNVSEELLADGNTILTLQAIVGINVEEFRLVTFKKSKGMFLGVDSNESIRPINQNGIAEIQYKVPIESGRIFFSAEVGGDGNKYIVEEYIDLQKAYPDALIIESNTASISNSNPVDLTIYTKRHIGKVSDDVPINFIAYQIKDNDTLSVGRFTNASNSSTSNEQVLGVKFYIDTNDYYPERDIIIEASSQGSGQEVVSGSIKLNIIE